MELWQVARKYAILLEFGIVFAGPSDIDVRHVFKQEVDILNICCKDNYLREENRSGYKRDHQKDCRKKNKKRNKIKTLAIPILLYGSETWIMGADNKRSVQTAEMKFLRYVDGSNIMDRIRNVEIREDLQIQSMEAEVYDYIHNWTEHLSRMDYSRFSKLAMHCTPRENVKKKSQEVMSSEYEGTSSDLNLQQYNGQFNIEGDVRSGNHGHHGGSEMVHHLAKNEHLFTEVTIGR
ncbi:hypothetical protein ANN_09392 [Periplaneta americana]|uniref:Uncharacterized protein n=1 Tax=Periplaneta americana TaxID=6978 RepID=A0ABQ8TL82_PERAM|nr:hypothetical protein ANN_09392 [Periplaneta americana]